MVQPVTTEDAQAGVFAMLEQILPANGYQTDLGARIFKTAEGIPQATGSPLAVLLGWTDREAGLSGSNGRLTQLEMRWEVYVDGIDLTTNQVLHRVGRDLKRAIRRPPPALKQILRGKVKPLSLEVMEPSAEDNFTLARFEIAVEFEERFD